MRLPEKTRRALERVVNELKGKENVYGIGLFGSWSRDDATASSDVDLFILDKSTFSYEYAERIEAGGILIDLDYVPKMWISGPIPPELDQKLYEMQILYDRDWSLTNTKLLMGKSYSSVERVDIRAEAHIVDSDIYLSRATSALSRGDYQSGYLFAVVALESILKVLIEAVLAPFSNSHFIERIESSTAKLGMHDLFNEYLKVAKLDKADRAGTTERLKLFEAIWDEISFTTRRGTEEMESSHFKVRTKLNYYLNPVFLHGAKIRACSLIDSEKMAEASHYLKSTLLDIVENYVWFRSSTNKTATDCTILMRSLESLEKKNPENYRKMALLLDLHDIEKNDVPDAIEKTREIMLRIRRDRKVLIKSQSTKSQPRT